MNTQELIEKMNSGELTSDEQREVFMHINEEMGVLKEQNPEKYLELVKQLNQILEDLNKDLKDI
jgi:hypothetical protein